MDYLIIMSPLSQVQTSSSVQSITNAEIEHAIMTMHPDKALSPDGFPVYFFQQYRYIIKAEILDAVHFFFQFGNLPDSWTKTFITLISKKSNPKIFNDYHPINLCNTVYKIIAKILTNRLKLILPHLISLEQGTLILNQNITENLLLAQEIMHSLVTAPRSKALMMLNLDMEKAYDRVH